MYLGQLLMPASLSMSSTGQHMWQTSTVGEQNGILQGLKLVAINYTAGASPPKLTTATHMTNQRECSDEHDCLHSLQALPRRDWQQTKDDDQEGALPIPYLDVHREAALRHHPASARLHPAHLSKPQHPGMPHQTHSQTCTCPGCQPWM